MKSVTLTKPAVTEMARRLATFLHDKHHVDIRHSNALDAIAAIFGWRNRQAMSVEIADKSGNAVDTKEDRRTLFVLCIEHRHGNDISVHTSEEEARDDLAGFVGDWWYEIDEPVDTSDMERDAAIDFYFEHQPGETYSISRHEIDLGKTD